MRRFNGRDELDEAFGNEHGAEVHAFRGAFGNNVGDVVDDVDEAHVVLGFDFFADDADVGLGLKGTFEGDMAGRAAHQFNEMPVFLRRVTVALDIADKLAVDFRSGVEAERGLDHLVLEVAVDCLRAAEYLNVTVRSTL